MILSSHSLHSLFLRISIVLVLLWVWSTWASTPHSYRVLSSSNQWQFNADQHANIHTFTNEQCDIAFPELYTSLQASVIRRQGRKISEEEISIKEGRCMLRILIYNGELFVIDDGIPQKCYVKNGNERERILGTLAQIDRSLTTSAFSDPAIPNIEFSLSLDDLPRRSSEKGVFWAYTRKNTGAYDDIWLMPNYAYWSWNYTHAPSWNSIRNEILENETLLPWEKKDPRVVWRGKIKMAALRKALVQQSQGKTWSDIKPVVINNETDPHSRDVMNLRDFCRYKYTVQTEGTSYSGRLKYLQLCRSALITHPLEWQEFHTHLMRVDGPDVNFIETTENFGNLEAAMEYFRKNDHKAEDIANNSYNTFARRYLTPAAVTCYWRRLFWTWSKMQGYEVQLYNVDAQGQKVMRGTPWTAFAANWPKNPAAIP